MKVKKKGYKPPPEKSRRPNKPTPAPPRIIKCQHKNTVALNEEGHAGIYCVDCGEKLEDAC